MNKFILSAALAAAVASPLLTQSAHAQDSDANQPQTNQLDNFFVDGNLGQTQSRNDFTHNHSVFQNVRFGWRWNGYVGPEIGYVYLGRPKTDFSYIGSPINSGSNGQVSTKSRAATVGVNGKYDFYGNWFVTGHAGYMRSRTKIDGSVDGQTVFTDRTWNNGWYAGLGVGYDVTRNVSIGVNYDNYHLQYGDNSTNGELKNNVAAFSGSVEYRF